MSSMCSIRQVKKPGTCILSTDLNYLISRVSYVHSSRTTDESLHYFVLPSENQNAFARSADFEFQLILYLGHPVILGPRLYSRIETSRHLVRSDFLHRLTPNFEVRRRVPIVNKQTDEVQKEHTHISLSLSTCRSSNAMFTLACLH